MSTEERAMAVLARANPMPDTDSLELESNGVTYLATLQQRSSEVTQLDTQKTEATEGKRPRRMLLVAAISIMLIGVLAVILTTQGDEDQPPATQPPPTTVAEAAPTTDLTPPTTVEALDAWEELPLLSLAGLPGTYRTNSFSPAFSWTVPAGWGPLESSPDIWVIGAQTGDDPYIHVGVTRPQLGSVEETVQAIIDIGKPDEPSQPEITNVTIDGASGMTFEFSPGEQFQGGRLDFGSGSIYPFSHEETETVHVLDVNGETIVVFIKSFYGVEDETGVEVVIESPPERQAEAVAIVESIVWRDPTE